MQGGEDLYSFMTCLIPLTRRSAFSSSCCLSPGEERGPRAALPFSWSPPFFDHHPPPPISLFFFVFYFFTSHYVRYTPRYQLLLRTPKKVRLHRRRPSTSELTLFLVSDSLPLPSIGPPPSPRSFFSPLHPCLLLPRTLLPTSNPSPPSTPKLEQRTTTTRPSTSSSPPPSSPPSTSLLPPLRPRRPASGCSTLQLERVSSLWKSPRGDSRSSGWT